LLALLGAGGFVRRLVIDTDLCVGNGRCYSLAPDLVIDDESGYGQVIGDGAVDDAHIEVAQRVVLACPEHAISIVDD
jgi:ferredoxin